jgi:hypothetical protein
VGFLYSSNKKGNIWCLSYETFFLVNDGRGKGARVFAPSTFFLASQIFTVIAWSSIHSSSFSLQVTDEPNKARVLQYTRMERLEREKHSNLLGPPLSYEEYEM